MLYAATKNNSILIKGPQNTSTRGNPGLCKRLSFSWAGEEKRYLFALPLFWEKEELEISQKKKDMILVSLTFNFPKKL